MIEFSEVQLKQNKSNFFEDESEKERTGVEANTLTRKIAFDRGIPLNFEFSSNYVQTIDYNVTAILLLVFKKILSRPLQILISILMIYYILVYLFLSIFY